jgi:hypothetical protein
MIEAYAFLAAFTLQILAMSVLYPAWLIGYVREKAKSYPAEQLAALHPSIDRSVTLYRALNTSIAVLGLLPLVWLFNYLQRPDWDDGPVEAMACAYFMLQTLAPLGLVAWSVTRYNSALQVLLLEGKRKAFLTRRTLFDFVSPLTVLVAALSYFLFAALVIYIQRDPFPGFAGYINIVAMTLLYAANGGWVYWMLYGRKINPFETPTGRVQMIGPAVKAAIYSCIACVVFLSLNFMLVLQDLQRWEPFAQSTFFIISALLSFMGLTALSRRREELML